MRSYLCPQMRENVVHTVNLLEKTEIYENYFPHSEMLKPQLIL